MKKIAGKGVVYNCPEYVKNGDFIVVRESDGELWFFGDYKNDLNRAYEVAKKEGGIVMIAMEAITGWNECEAERRGNEGKG